MLYYRVDDIRRDPRGAAQDSYEEPVPAGLVL